jgi:DnaJ-domain-containing protein 1
MIRRFLPWIIGAAYFICPYDLFPDFFVGPGWLDDLVVLGLVWWWNTRRGRMGPEAAADSAAGGSQREGMPPDDDPYDVLGVSPGASMEEIRAAYRRLVAQYHPDKVQHLGPEFQKLAHEKFVAVQQAYQRLKR